jgi:hypothetical protein
VRRLTKIAGRSRPLRKRFLFPSTYGRWRELARRLIRGGGMAGRNEVSHEDAQTRLPKTLHSQGGRKRG